MINVRRMDAPLFSVLGHLLPWLLLCALFAGVGVMHVTARILVVRVGYQLSTAEAQYQRLSREHDRLKLELATLKSPAKLERVARERLGMGPPPGGRVVAVGPAEPKLSKGPALE